MSSERGDGKQGLGGGDSEVADQDGDSLASKLSKELSNWRRRRTVARPHRIDGGGARNGKSEPARTIKVRGHETLVIRKPKLVPKGPANPAEPSDG